MTPREPDRYEEFVSAIRKGDDPAAILRIAIYYAKSSALERAAQVADRNADTYGAGIGMIANRGTAKEIRALASPAAAPAAEKVTPELFAAHAADLAAGRHDLNGAYGCSICGTSPSEPAAPAPDLVTQRNRFEKCAQLFAEIRGDWTDPRDACREGRKLCMEALADIDAKLAARAATGKGEV